MRRRSSSSLSAQRRLLQQRNRAAGQDREVATEALEVMRQNRSTWPERWLAIVAIGTLVATIYQSQSASRQSEVAAVQLESTQDEIAAGQRSVDLAMLGDVGVSVEADSFSITNRSEYPLINTGTWLVADDHPNFHALLVEVNGVPSCSRVEVPLDHFEESVGPVGDHPHASTDGPWDPFTDAYVFFTGPSGNWFSTSSQGGIVDHNTTEWRGDADAAYGDHEFAAFWEDINVLVSVPDSFWEYGDVQMGQLLGSPFRPGEPLIGARYELELEELECV